MPSLLKQFLAHYEFSHLLNSFFHFLLIFFAYFSLLAASFLTYLWDSVSYAQLFSIISIYIHYQASVLTCTHNMKVIIGWVNCLFSQPKSSFFFAIISYSFSILIYPPVRNRIVFLKETKSRIHCHSCIKQPPLKSLPNVLQGQLVWSWFGNVL